MGTSEELPREAFASARLDDRIVALLGSEPGQLAFNGLRRALNAHPESLVRALRRLERVGVVQRSASGYRLTAGSGAVPVPPEARRPHEVALVELPPDADAESVLGQLAGRWFGPLRWAGVIDDPGDPSLVWTVVGAPGRVVAAVREGRLRITVEDPANAPGPALLDAARELVVHSVAGVLKGGRGRTAPVLAFSAPARRSGPLNN